MLSKLQHLLSSALTEECQVVYFLVELRKALELRELRSKYAALKFYCDWAMQARLEGARAREFLKRIDDMETAHGFGMFGDGGPKLAGAMEFLRQDLFRRDLREALRELDLNSDICTINNLWVSFLDLYAGVIADCPLVIKSTSALTQYVEQAVASRVKSPLPDDLKIDEADPAFAFAMEWRIKLKQAKFGNQRSLISCFSGMIVATETDQAKLCWL